MTKIVGSRSISDGIAKALPAIFLIASALFLLVFPSPGLAQSDPEIEPGRGEFLNRASNTNPRSDEAISSGPLTVRYAGADISVIIDDIVGEVLGLDYTIAADVQGQVSLRMTEVATRSAVLEQLQAAFASINVAMVDRGDFIAFVRGGNPAGTGSVALIRPGEIVTPGVSVAALQLREATPSAVAQLLGALVTEADIRLVDDARSLLIVAGEAEALSAASEAANLLDVRYLDEVSRGAFRLQHAQVSTVSAELSQVLQAAPETLEIIAIERLNLLIVFANSSDLLRRAQTWIERLDQPTVQRPSEGQRLYTVQHVDPTELVIALQAMAGVSTEAGAQGQRQSGSERRSGNLLLDDIRIGAAPNRNLILVQGDESRLDAIVETLALLDLPRPQVTIEAAIIEVTLTDETRFGIDWNAVEDDRLSFGFSGDPDPSTNRQFPGFSAVYINTDLDIALNALSLVSELEVISRPSLLVLHIEAAELQVGDQVPVTVQSAVSVTDPNAPIVNQTAYRNTGVLLNVIPQVRAGGLVEIEISQEVSGVVTTTTSGIDSPTITQRRLQSTLLVPSGETVALGGLISTRTTQSESGVPILRHAPLIGRAFRSESQSEDRTELIVLITPYVVLDPNVASADIGALPVALERLRGRLVGD